MDIIFLSSELLVGNSGVRYETVNGRQFIVAPMTILRPQVLAGSKGPLYYPQDEIDKSIDAWNGKPIVRYHPTRNGVNVSANAPDIFQKQEIGRVFNSKKNKDGNNVAEGWFDAELVKKHDDRIYNALVEGRKIELSTGLFTDNEEASQGSNHNGVEYGYIARNYKPDHLAILPDERGACSLNDGCGVFNNDINNAGGGGCGDGHGGFKPGNTCAKGGSGSGSTGSSGDSSHSNLSSEQHSHVKQTIDTIGKPGNHIPKTEQAIHGFALTHYDNRSAIRSAFPGKKGDKEFAATVVAEYKKSNKLESNSNHIDNSLLKHQYPEKCPHCGTLMEIDPDSGICNRCGKKVKILNIDLPSLQSSLSEKTTMNERNNLISWLTTNCTCYKDKKPQLDQLTDNALKEVLLENAEKGVETDNDQSFLEWIGNADKEIKNAFVGHLRNKIKRSVGNDFPIPSKKTDTPTKTTPQEPNATDTTGTDADAAKAAALEEERKKKAMMDQQHAAMNSAVINELKELIPSLKTIVANHKQQDDSTKVQLIALITNRVTDTKEKLAVANSLKDKSVDDLRLTIKLMGISSQEYTVPTPVANFFGASGGPSDIVDNSYLQTEKLDFQNYDWADMAKNTTVYDSAK